MDLVNWSRTTLGLVASLALSCGSGADPDVGPRPSTDEAAAPSAPSVEVDHLLFSRPTSRAALAQPSGDSALSRLLAEETLWLIGQSYRKGQFQMRSAEEGERFRGSLWRAPVRIPPAGDGIRGRMDALTSPKSIRESFRANEDEPSLASLHKGDVLIDRRGVHVMRSPNEGGPGDLSLSYPARSADVLDELMTIPPVAGSRVDAQELRVHGDTARCVQLATTGDIGWKLRPDEGGASLRFGYGLKSMDVILEEGAVRLYPAARHGARFSVLLLRDGAESVLWTAKIQAKGAGNRRRARIDALPDDVAGAELVLRVEPLEGVDPSELILATWAEPVLRKVEEPERPNVLFLLLDTLRADRLGCYGYDRPTSPFLDELAAEGVRYADVWSAAPWTLPSHASLFSSLYMSEHGVWDRRFRLSDEAVTIAEVMRNAGYETGAFTASGYVRPEYGFAQGFDRFWFSGDEVERIFREAIQWIDESRGPFFAFVHTYHVHSPHDPEGDARELLVRPYDGALPEVVHTPDYDWGQRKGDPLPQADVQYVSDLYDAEIREVDAAVKALVEALRASGKLDDTLIVVTSDHGEEFSDHMHFEHGWSLYQEQLFVPLILHMPGRYDGGRVVEHPVIGIDIAPTIAEVVGEAIPSVWSGAPLGFEPPAKERPIWIPYRTRDTGHAAVALRRGSAKYIEFPGWVRTHDRWDEPRLYDLAEDPGERNDIWPDEASRDRKRWKRAAESLEAAYPSRHETREADTGADMAAQLKALGYGG